VHLVGGPGVALSADAPYDPFVSSPVVLFDGVCNLCNGSVNFVIDHERGTDLRFAALQSDAARKLVAAAAGEVAARELAGGDEPASIVVVEDGKVYTRSTAALRVARHLRAPWRWLAVFVLVPRPIRDAVYRWIARRRYRWFGKADQCRVPTPELRARFLA
jgi:predicted DCC family thiol-disulfide oxidoreductase YuxK